MTKKQDLAVRQRLSADFEIGKVKGFTKNHVNYHNSMTFAGLTGIWDLNASAALRDPNTGEVNGYLTLRVVMYKKMKMRDGHPLGGGAAPAVAHGSRGVGSPYLP